MNYNKVIKNLKERNDILQEQYRLRDIKCIHLEYENEMLKSDFEAQHELTKKYAKENQELKKQLDYLRSGEYYNQLRFENEMLQQVVDTNGVPSEVYDYIDCTHRNTELLEENQELKKQLEVGEQQYNDLVEEKEKLDAENQVLKDYKNVALTYMKNYLKMELNYRNKDVAEHFKVVIDMLNRGNKHGNLVDIIDCDTQQKEFIEYLTSYIDLLSNKPDLIEEAEIDILEEILSKYKEIIGGK